MYIGSNSSCLYVSPFVQRVWISLELKDLSYQYIEVDPYKKPDWLLEINPRGLVPALRHEDWTCYESTVLMEYVRAMDNPRMSQDANNNSLRIWVKVFGCCRGMPRVVRILACGLTM